MVRMPSRARPQTRRWRWVCRTATVLTVDVADGGSLEAAAREARYNALRDARADLPVLLGHTLGRSGRDRASRTLARVRWAIDSRYGCIRRSLGTAAPRPPAIGDQGGPASTWASRRGRTRTTNNPEFTRVRLRHEALPLLEEILGGGVPEALARTATQLREDGEALDEYAEALLLRVVVDGEVEVDTLAEAHTAIRRRALRAWLLQGGAKALTDKQLRAVDALVTDWRGQGGVAIGGRKHRRRGWWRPGDVAG